MKEAPLNKLRGHHQRSSGKDKGLQRPQSIRREKAVSVWDNCWGVWGVPPCNWADTRSQGDERWDVAGGKCGVERCRAERSGVMRSAAQRNAARCSIRIPLSSTAHHPSPLRLHHLIAGQRRAHGSDRLPVSGRDGWDRTQAEERRKRVCNESLNTALWDTLAGPESELRSLTLRAAALVPYKFICFPVNRGRVLPTYRPASPCCY